MSTKILNLLEKIGKERESYPILYYTGDKKPLELFGTVVATDTLTYFLEILQKANTQKVSLILNTLGGNIDLPWPLVNYIREYSQKFEVIVLNEALSAGTLICMGADKIIMQPYSHLSPIDPSKNILDTKNENQPRNKKLEIEDIIGFVEFSKDKIGIKKQQELSSILDNLCKEIDPTVIGSVNRGHSLIRRLARQMLTLQDPLLSKKVVNKIVANLTQDLFSHNHRINRNEAKNSIGFGDMIEYSSKSLSENVGKLIEEIRKYLQLDELFQPDILLRDKDSYKYEIPRALIFSKDSQYVFKGVYQIGKMPEPNGNIQFEVKEINSLWEKDE